MYNGAWAEDLPNGAGIYIFADKSKFDGRFKDGKKNGRGKFTDGKTGETVTQKYVMDVLQAKKKN